MSPPFPKMVTFDVFGTIVDWRRGMREAVVAAGGLLADPDFDRVVDAQAVEEARAPFRTYREITASSLTRVLGLDPSLTDGIGAAVGRWPLYADAAPALGRLRGKVRCVAMTNSDRVHGEQVQQQIGFHVDAWVCSEETRCYKPAPAFWDRVRERTGTAFGPEWWHVSAYADYDLAIASSLGLTTVFVSRPHSRAGLATIEVPDLQALAVRVEGTA